MKISDVKGAAERAREELALSDTEAEFVRGTLEVRVGSRTEVVTVAPTAHELTWATTGESPSPTHAAAALALLAGGPRAALSSADAPVRASIRPPMLGAAVPDPTVDEPPLSAEQGLRIAAAFEDVVTAVLRAGLAKASESSTVRATLGILPTLVRGRTALRLRRGVELLGAALAARDDVLTVLTLHAIARTAEALRSIGPVSLELQRPLTAWLGCTPECAHEPERLEDRSLVEVGRETVAAGEGEFLSRRYWVETRTGELLREEQLGAASDRLTAGPCPRTIDVGLASVLPGASPRVIAVAQYTVSSDVSEQAWSRVARVARRQFASVATETRDLVREVGALAEPVFLFAPRALVTGTDAADVLRDEHGDSIGLTGDGVAVPAGLLERLSSEGTLEWVLGRVTATEGRLRLRPLSLLRRGPRGSRLVRVT